MKKVFITLMVLLLTGCRQLFASSPTASSAPGDISSDVSSDGSNDVSSGISSDGSSSDIESSGDSTQSSSSSAAISSQTPTPSGDGWYRWNNHDSGQTHPQLYDGWNSTQYGLMPTKGNVKVPVILIDFSDKPSSTAAVSKSEIEKAFFGSASDTGWHSLRSYYALSSNGQLNITGDVYGWYRAPYASSYYDDIYDEDAMDSLIKAAVSYYNSSVDFSKYDSNDDGILDALYLIYSLPTQSGEDNNFWAYQYYYYGEEQYDNTYVYPYVWMSASFFDPDYYYNTTPMDGLNAETLIHESGHLLGMPDLYDYTPSKGPKGGLGGADMMDHNIGDHGPFNKMFYGWSNPMVVDGTASEVTFQLETDDIVLISNQSNISTMFSEYILIDFYTPSAPLSSTEYYDQPGIRMYQVDATVARITSGGQSWYDFANDNSETTNKLIRYVENGGSMRIETGNSVYAGNNTLYHQGDVFGVSQWSTIPWYKSYNSGFKFQMTVNSVTNQSASITINLPGK